MSQPAADDAMTSLISGGLTALARPDAPAEATLAEDDGGRMVGASLALALLRAIREAAYVMERDGRVTYINSAGLRQLGLTRQPGRRDGCYLWDLWPDASADHLRQALAEAAEGDEVEMQSVLCPQEEGATAPCHVRLSPVEDSMGQVSKILIMARPV